MKYENMVEAAFLRRPNRFIAYIELDGQEQICHVKNTGRCRELLTPGARIIVQRAANPARKTPYDLISVWKGEKLINMDAAAPNAVFAEFLAQGGLGFVPEFIKPECVHGNSRFDFYFEHNGRKAFAEIKGVTLESGGIASFPDAPTARGIKHLEGLARCVQEGYEAYAVFIVQMKGVRLFRPAAEIHPDFAKALEDAKAAGVNILCFDCLVGFDTLDIDSPLEVRTV